MNSIYLGMGAILVIFVLYLVFKAINGDSKPRSRSSSGPMVYGGRGDYNSHLDFLEAHGCITAEERQAQRDFEEDYRKNPQNYKTQTLEEFLKDYKKDSGETN